MNGKDQEFGGVVGMFGVDDPLKVGDVGIEGLEHDQDFGSRLQCVLPPIVGFDAGNEIRAGGLPGPEGGRCQAARGGEVRGRHEDQTG